MAFAATAMAAALAWAASDTDKKPVVEKAYTMRTFQYNGLDFSQTEVQKNSNWNYTTNTTACPAGSDIACKINVSDAYVVPDGSGYKLDPSLVITASSGSISHVISTTEGSDATYVSNTLN
ncbi:hypothetical protein [Niabella terrae]